MLVNADWFEPVTLDGSHVRLEALSTAHVQDLWQAGQDDDVWRWLPVARPADVAAMQGVVEAALIERERGNTVPWAIIDCASGRAVGSTSYLDVVPAHLRVEVGWTWLGRPWWRTAINTEAKLLLLARAFDDLEARRVSLKTDAENLRSQAAIQRLGAVREGALRAHMVRPDGSPRTTAYFSLLRDEWPAARAHLLERLHDWSGRGVSVGGPRQTGEHG